MLYVSLVYLLFHMNLFIPSYSAGKLAIRMIHVHIRVVQMSLIVKHA